MDTRSIHDRKQLLIVLKLNGSLFQNKLEDHPFTELGDIKIILHCY